MPATGPFPREERIRRRREFLAVRAARSRIRAGGLRLEWLVTESPRHRVGFTVTKFRGSAPLRNRIKRLLREAWRHERDAFPRGRDYVFVPEDPDAFSGLSTVRALMRTLATRLSQRT